MTSTRAATPLALSTCLPPTSGVVMRLVQRSLVVLAWDHAVTAMEATRVTREHSVAERDAWFRWRRRWHELETEGPGQRTLVVCATCARYRDGLGRWVPMPDGLNEVLASARSLCVSHGLCPACSASALDAVKVLPPTEPAGARFGTTGTGPTAR